jgi:hypothetical protein
MWHVSPIPPLDPYVRLSPHTAHESGILWEGSISPAPRYIPHGQRYAFAGYLCTVSRPAPSGPLPCTRLSRIRTTMPCLTACRASEFRLGLPMPTSHPPSHPCQALPCSLPRTQTRWVRWRVYLPVPSALCGSPVGCRVQQVDLHQPFRHHRYQCLSAPTFDTLNFGRLADISGKVCQGGVSPKDFTTLHLVHHAISQPSAAS